MRKRRIMAMINTMPPMTPPTIAPMGIFFELLVVLPAGNADLDALLGSEVDD